MAFSAICDLGAVMRMCRLVYDEAKKKKKRWQKLIFII